MTGWWAASYVVLWILVVALSLVVLALARQVGVLHMRLGPRGALEMDEEGPPLGEAPPPVEATDLDGRPMAVGGPGDDRLLLFVSPDCPICREVLPSVPVVARQGRMRPLVIADGDVSHAQAVRQLTKGETHVVAGDGVAASFSVPGTPYAVVLDGMGVVRAKGTVNNLEQVEGLVDTARRRLAAVPG